MPGGGIHVMKQRNMFAVGGLAFGLGGLTALLSWLAYSYTSEIARSSGNPTWTEVAWPFALDEWGKGKAFHCKAADCGTDVHVYIRAKIGFCNCTTGVADDEELARLSDFRLMGESIGQLGPGRSIKVAWMKGRSRPYAVAKPLRASRSALSIAFNDRCDAIVATAMIGRASPDGVEPAIMAFLNGDTVIRWAEVTIGL
jgi:hypothetical protein